MNNIAGAHEAFTVTYAGTFQVEELQYIAANYRQVLTSEGLYAFANASYAAGRPGTDVLRALDYRSRSSLFNARPRLSGDSLARDEPDGFRPRLRDQR